MTSQLTTSMPWKFDAVCGQNLPALDSVMYCIVRCFRVQAEMRRREEEQRLKNEEEAEQRRLEEQLQWEEAEAEKEVCLLLSL